ncbi:MAG TPA: ATPase [Prevotella sp.]|nr:ATPase [Prevotella sp.]
MDLKNTFQSIIALHQQEIPLNLLERATQLPLDEGRIVTVTGIRRCGKSSLLGLAINRLLKNGVPRERILYVGFDDERFLSMSPDNFDELLQAYREMYPHTAIKDVYMFFDEIQLVKGWELFVLRVYKNYCKHIFITGSTAKMLSEEMASALRGWPDEYREYPLSFSEYLRFKNIKANRYTEEGKAVLASAFRTYCEEGGFPEVALTTTKSDKIKILQSYFNTMLFRDMMEHYNIGTPSFVVRYFLKRVMNNLTKPTSVNNIYNDLKSQGLKVSKDSLYLWLDYACNIFMLRKVEKYDKSIVKQRSASAKYYVADIALHNAVLLPESEDSGKALENIVYLNLERSLGEEDRVFYYNDSKECDFVVQRGERVAELIQVCWVLNEENIEREIGGLLAASTFTGCTKCSIITFNQQQSLERNGLHIDVKAIWNV